MSKRNDASEEKIDISALMAMGDLTHGEKVFKKCAHFLKTFSPCVRSPIAIKADISIFSSEASFLLDIKLLNNC